MSRLRWVDHIQKRVRGPSLRLLSLAALLPSDPVPRTPVNTRKASTVCTIDTSGSSACGRQALQETDQRVAFWRNGLDRLGASILSNWLEIDCAMQTWRYHKWREIRERYGYEHPSLESTASSTDSDSSDFQHQSPTVVGGSVRTESIT